MIQHTNLITVWSKHRPPNDRSYLHSHASYEIVYYFNGNGKTTIGGCEYDIQPNYFVLIPPHVEHSEIHYSEAFLLCLEFEIATDLPFLYLSETTMSIQAILKSILKETSEQKYLYKDIINHRLEELYYLFLRYNKSGAKSEKNFEYIINYIEENYHEKINFSDCSKQLNISYDYFHHKFKTITGYSPQNYLIRQRLDAAKKMLMQGNMNCTEIAYSCGFSSSAQFSTLFKKEYSFSPLDYRKRHKK